MALGVADSMVAKMGIKTQNVSMGQLLNGRGKLS